MPVGPMRALVAGLLTAALLGCAGNPPIQRFTFATTDPDAVKPRIVRRDVRGKDCFTQSFVRVLLTPPWKARRADHGRAVGSAMSLVPEADVLTNVRMSVSIQQYILFQRTCALVAGDAGVLE